MTGNLVLFPLVRCMIRPNLCRNKREGEARADRSGLLTCQLGSVPSLRDSPHTLSIPGTSVPGYRLYRPYGTRPHTLIHTRHFRAGLQAVPSLRDSPSYPYPYPALPCRATGCAVPTGLASYPYPYPALPCRAAGCAVPSGLASYPYPYPALPCRVQAVTSLRDSPHTLILTRHFHAGLQAVPSLRDSPHTLSLPGTSVPGYGCAVPSGLLCCGSNSSLAMRTSPQACRAIRRGLAGFV
jgi:hypothetical protein